MTYDLDELKELAREVNSWNGALDYLDFYIGE